MSSNGEDIIRETFEKFGDAIGVQMQMPAAMITNLGAVLQAQIDLLAELQSAGRLIPTGGMALTAEQVEDVTAVASWALHQTCPSKVRERASRILRALFPATGPAEEVKPVHPRPNVGDWGYGGGAAVYAPEVRGKTREELLSEKVEQLQDQVKHLSGVAVNAAEHGIPAPAEPAEEETKAESHMDKHGVIVTGSPVVPAPTETEWQTWQEVPEGVTVKSANGERFRKTGIGAVHLLTNGVGDCCKISVANDLQPAPFVAAEEG